MIQQRLSRFESAGDILESWDGNPTRDAVEHDVEVKMRKKCHCDPFCREVVYLNETYWDGSCVPFRV